MLSNLNLIERQIFAAYCFSEYCSFKDIKHPEIENLISHLVSIKDFRNNLLDWEQKGGLLNLAGRGDDIPPDIRKMISNIDIKNFGKLLECCVEVGLVNMYGAETNQSFHFLNDCIRILENEKIPVPYSKIL